MVIPTPGQVRDVLEAADEHYAALLFALCAFGGLRLGEAAGVQLADINFLRRTLHVERGVTGDAEWLFRGPRGNPPDRASVGYWWRKATKAEDTTGRAAAGLMGQVFSPPADSERTAEG